MPDDEKTGAHAKRGFRYQDWWSTLKTFEVWSTSNLDFVIGTEGLCCTNLAYKVYSVL